VHRNNVLVYNSNKMHKSLSLFNLTIALHVSGITITHFRSTKQLQLQHLVTITPYCCLLLLCKSWNWFGCVVGGVFTPPTTHLLLSWKSWNWFGCVVGGVFTPPTTHLLLSWKSWNWFGCVVGGVFTPPTTHLLLLWKSWNWFGCVVGGVFFGT